MLIVDLRSSPGCPAILGPGTENPFTGDPFANPFEGVEAILERMRAAQPLDLRSLIVASSARVAQILEVCSSVGRRPKRAPMFDAMAMHLSPPSRRLRGVACLAPAWVCSLRAYRPRERRGWGTRKAATRRRKAAQ